MKGRFWVEVIRSPLRGGADCMAEGRPIANKSFQRVALDEGKPEAAV